MADFQVPGGGNPPSIPGFAAQPMARAMPGGFWRRVAAMLIDGVIIAFVTTPLNMVTSLALGVGIANQNFNSSGYWMATGMNYVINMALSFAFYGWFLSNKGATPGKMVLGLKVLDNDNGTNLTFVRGGLRGTVGYFVSSITFLIGYLMVAFREDKRALHDLMFNTHVWHKEDK
jgi:uncharacterized RDD family membrane protein YckC